MSCRVRRAAPQDCVVIEALRTSIPYLELARAGRREDFDWLARSQGVDADVIEPLWRQLREIATRSAQTA